jgi:lipoate-protein ligase A
MNRPADPADLPTLPWTRDDALLDRVRATGELGVAAYPCDHAAVVIGRGGRQADEVRREVIAADGIPFHRRAGGGCAVVLDPGNVVVSVALPMPGIGGISTAFAAISAWMADVLDRCGVPGVGWQGVSDLVLGDRKIGGSCIWRTRGLLYYSTTILVAPDLDLIDRYLPHPPREPSYRGGRDHRHFLTTLRDEGLAGDPVALAARLERVANQQIAKLASLYQDLP